MGFYLGEKTSYYDSSRTLFEKFIILNCYFKWLIFKIGKLKSQVLFNIHCIHLLKMSQFLCIFCTC